jgi:cyanophycinase
VSGVIALQGGGPFQANDDLDRRLLTAAGAESVVVLPTADAFEHPGELIAAAMRWGERLGVHVEALMVLSRPDALDVGAAAVIRGARAVYLAGDSPMHLRSVLKDTPVYEALAQVVVDGGVVTAVGQSANALCDPMTDPRGGAFTLGLGLVSGVALVTEVESWSHDRLARTVKLAAGKMPLVSLATGTALLRHDAAWEPVGEIDIHGDLPM